MKLQPGKLGIREYTSIGILMMASKAADSTPSTLYSHVQNAAWMVPILTGAMMFVPLFLLLKTLSVFKDKNLFAVIQQLLGKYIGFVVCLLIFLISSAAISADTREYTNIIRTFYFTTTPHLVIYALLLFVCAYGAKKGIQHIGSISYLVLFYVLLSFYLALIFKFSGRKCRVYLSHLGTWKMGHIETKLKEYLSFCRFFFINDDYPLYNLV